MWGKWVNNISMEGKWHPWIKHFGFCGNGMTLPLLWSIFITKSSHGLPLLLEDRTGRQEDREVGEREKAPLPMTHPPQPQSKNSGASHLYLPLATRNNLSWFSINQCTGSKWAFVTIHYQIPSMCFLITSYKFNKYNQSPEVDSLSFSIQGHRKALPWATKSASVRSLYT